MSFNMKANKSGDGEGFAKAPAGNHPAVLVAIIDMGTQKNDFGGEVKWQHRAFFVWELTSEVVEGTKDKHHLIGIDLTLSLNEKAKLRKWIEARTGKPLADGAEFDAASELGKPCLLNVIEKGGYPKIDAVTAFPKGFPEPKPQQQPFSWSLQTYMDNGGQINLPDWLPWYYGRAIAETIKECKEIGQTGAPRAAKAESNNTNTSKFAGQGGGATGATSGFAAPDAQAATTAPKPPMAPPKPANGIPEPPDDSQWNVWLNEAWKPMTGKDVKAMCTAKGATLPENLFVCPMGSETTITAAAAGFTNIPW